MTRSLPVEDVDDLDGADSGNIPLIDFEHVKAESLGQDKFISSWLRAVVGPVEVEAVEAIPVRQGEAKKHWFESLRLLEIELLEGSAQGGVEAGEGGQADVVGPACVRLVLAQEVGVIINNLLPKVAEFKEQECLVEVAAWVNALILRVVEVNAALHCVDALLLYVFT